MCPESYREDQVLGIYVVMERLYNMYVFERKKWEERRRRRVWKFQGDCEEKRHQYVPRAIGKTRFCESVL